MQYVIRPFSKRGHYPDYELQQGPYFFGKVNDLLIGVAPKLEPPQPDESYSEFDEISPGEIALMAALTLSVLEEMGSVGVYPMPNSTVMENLPAGNLRMSPEFISACNRLSEEAVRQEKIIGEREYFEGSANEYAFNSNTKIDLAKTIIANFPTHSALLLRGMHALIKAKMLVNHRQFNEEGALSAYVAREASYQMIRQSMRSVSTKKIGPADVAEYMRENFDPRWENDSYLPDFYQDRVAVVHPVNKYGVFPYAPISHCDFYTLLDYLVPIFRWIIVTRQFDRARQKGEA